MLGLRSFSRMAANKPLTTIAPTMNQSLKRTFITSIRPANTKQPIEQAIYRSWWGVEPYLNKKSSQQPMQQPIKQLNDQVTHQFNHYSDALAQIKKEGYTGIEISLNQLFRLANPSATEHPTHEQVAQVLEAIRANNLSINLTVYSNWHDYQEWQRLSVTQHLRNFEDQLITCLSHGINPHLINAHVGCDSWSEHEHVTFFESCLRFQSLVDCPIVYETHRGRSLSNPYATHRLCDQFPSLKLTGDLSHWVMGCERMFDHPYERQIMSDMFSRMLYLHTRVGSTQSPQLILNKQPNNQQNNQKELDHYTAMWRAVWDARRQKGDKLFCWNPEIGPNYMQPNSDSDVWNYTNQEKARISALFDQWSAETLIKEAAAAPMYSVNHTVNKPLQNTTKVEHFSPFMHEAAILGTVAIPTRVEQQL